MSGVAPSAVFTEWWRSFEALPSRMRDSGRDRDPAGCEVSRGSPAGKRARLGSALAEELLTEGTSCEAGHMTAADQSDQSGENHLPRGRPHMADAVEAARQHVQEKATDELGGVER